MNKKGEFRFEQDSLGEMQIPIGAYWGIRTARARDAFAINGLKPHPKIVDGTVLTKKAAALANGQIGILTAQVSRSIVQAADEVLNGQWRDQFVVDPYQVGGSFSHNANVNEVLANRAAEILGSSAGTYALVHPDNHVNLGQSANDVFPTAMRLAILLMLRELEPVLLDLERLLRRKSLEFDKVVKVGRTHLRDSAPITLGQEFNAYGSSVERSYRRIVEASHSLFELNIGGTSVGTGLNADPAYISLVVEKLSQLAGLQLKPAEDYFRLTQSMADFVEFSSGLKELAVELNKIANDIRLLNSGPRAGLGELALPPLLAEPAPTMPESLPPRFNPALAECVSMVALQVIGNDLVVTLAAQSGQLEMNVMMPSIIHNILQSMELLKQVLLPFSQRCISGIVANAARCRELLETSGMVTSTLITEIGYEKAAAIARQSQETGRSIRDLLIEQDLVASEQLDRLLQFKSMTQPGRQPGTTSNTGSTGS